MNYFKPVKPDIYIKRPSDKTFAHFGHLNHLVNEINSIAERIGATVTAFGTTTAITTVPGTFADEAAIQTYLATAIPIIETRLDNIETKINAILTSLKTAGLMAS
jgi:hypothetical protein